MNTLNIEAERKLFEEWHEGMYRGLQEAIAWAAWKASAIQARPTKPDGWIATVIAGSQHTDVAFKTEAGARKECVKGEPVPYYLAARSTCVEPKRDTTHPQPAAEDEEEKCACGVSKSACDYYVGKGVCAVVPVPAAPSEGAQAVKVWPEFTKNANGVTEFQRAGIHCTSDGAVSQAVAPLARSADAEDEDEDQFVPLCLDLMDAKAKGSAAIKEASAALEAYIANERTVSFYEGYDEGRTAERTERATPAAAVELTDEQIDSLANAHEEKYGQLCDADDLRMFARAAVALAAKQEIK